MEYAGGGELMQYITEAGTLELPMLQTVTAEIINGLEYLHGECIIHRDLKPENIMLDAANHVKLIDFGTALCGRDGAEVAAGAPAGGRAGAAQRRRGSPAAPVIVGTFQYMAPELLDQGVTTPASDLWALGCVVYQMAAGYRPFDDEHMVRIFEQIRAAEGHVTYPPVMPDVVRDLASCLLVRDRSRRLGTEPMGGYSGLRGHPLFDGIRFEHLAAQELRYPPAGWVDVAPAGLKKTASVSCHACTHAFAPTDRRHRCRNCARVFCQRCSAGDAGMCDGCNTSFRRALAGSAGTG